MTTTPAIQRGVFSYNLDKRLDRKITELVNRGEFRSKSDVAETAIRELLMNRGEPIDDEPSETAAV